MKGIVASGHALTSRAAALVLEQGGNACDGVVAALLAATVTEPLLASPAGGGFLLVRSAAGRETLHDFFGDTPGQRNPDAHMWPIHGDFGDATQEFHIGPGSIAVPGFVAGLHAAQRAHCRLPLAELAAPAVGYARDGVEIGDFQLMVARILGPIVAATPELARRFDLGSDDLFRDPELADFLDALGREPAHWFYQGEPAAAIVEFCRAEGGHLSREDLAEYRCIERTPLRFGFRGHAVTTNPVPSCGGSLIAHLLALMAPDACDEASPEDPAYLAMLAEAMRLTTVRRHEVRLQHRHDEAAVAELLDRETLDDLARALREHPRARSGTTHISVVDADGNVAAATVSNGEGCGHVLPGTGIHLNNFLGEEDLNPDGPGNWLPGRRLSSMMAPTIVAAPTGGCIAVGSGGSNRLRTAIAQVILRWAAFDQSMTDAIRAPRMHVEGDTLNLEPGFSAAAMDVLRERFPDRVEWSSRSLFFGGTQAAGIENGKLVAAADDRRGGAVVVAR
ncbi:MAG: gamma-glutamyltransferase [Pseudomonadota bacterium]